jgi:hypothetical protein
MKTEISTSKTKIYALAIVLAMLTSSIVSFQLGTMISTPTIKQIDSLRVELASNMEKIYLGQTAILNVHVLNGTQPYEYTAKYEQWNMTGLISAQYEFSQSNQFYYTLNQSCLYINVYLTVKDANGATGEANLRIIDPEIAVPPWTLNAPPVSYADWTMGIYSNGTYFLESADWQTWSISDNSSELFNSIPRHNSVHVMGGLYNATATWIPKTGQDVGGAGRNITQVKGAAGLNAPVMYNEHAANPTADEWDAGIYIHDLKIDGNGANQVTTTVWTQTNMVCTFYADHLTNFTFRNVWFYDGRDYNLRLGFSRDNDNYVMNGLVENCLIENTTTSGGGNCDLGFGIAVTYAYCEARGSARDGFDFNGQEIKMIGCRSHHNAYNGIYIEGREFSGSVPCKNNEIISCDAWDNGDSGIVIDNTRDTRIIGGNYYSNPDSGIVLKNSGSTTMAYCRGLVVDGVNVYSNNDDGVANDAGINVGRYIEATVVKYCNIYDDQETATQLRGIYAATNALNGTDILYNNIQDCTTFGIYVGASAVNTRVLGNTIIADSTLTYGIQVVGTDNTEVAENRFYGVISYQLEISAGANFTKVHHNTFNASGTKIRINAAAFGTEIKHNFGYVTENSITASNTTASTIVYNHLLASTPTHVFASFNQTGITYTWTATSTEVTITVEAITGYTLPEVLTATIIEDCY